MNSSSNGNALSFIMCMFVHFDEKDIKFVN